MKIKIYDIFVVILFIISIIILHETTHYEIYKIYGCKNITYGWNWVATNDIDCQNESLYLAQSINEIVGYNIIVFLFFILVTVLFKEKEKD